MRYLVDTNILFRLLVPSEELHKPLVDVVARLVSQENEMCVTEQAFREVWHVCTRSRVHNGLGLSSEEAAALISELRPKFTLLPSSAASFERWFEIVLDRKISGAAVHDANQAAIAGCEGVSVILNLGHGRLSPVWSGAGQD